MAKYMFFFVGTEDAWDGLSTEDAATAAERLDTWWQDLRSRGIAKDGRELGHSRDAMTVRRVNGRMRVTDGPFIETKEHVGGYAVIEARDLDEAIAIAKSWPPREFTVEIRPVVEH